MFELPPCPRINLLDPNTLSFVMAVVKLTIVGRGVFLGSDILFVYPAAMSASVISTPSFDLQQSNTALTVTSLEGGLYIDPESLSTEADAINLCERRFLNPMYD